MDDPFEIDLDSRPYGDLFNTNTADPFAGVLGETKKVPTGKKNQKGSTSEDPFAEALKVPKPDRGLAEEFWTGLKRGVDATQAMGYGLSALAGDVLDVDALRKFGGEGYARNIQEASKNAASLRFSEIADGENFLEDASNFTKWASGGLGELLPNIAMMLAGGGVGGAAAKAVLPQIGKAAAQKYVSKSVQNQLLKNGIKNASKEVLESFTDQAYKNLGSTMGAFVTGTGLNTGEIFGNFIDPETGELIETTERGDRILGTIGGGLLAGALDSVVPAGIFRKLNKTKSQFIREALATVPKSRIAARAAGNILLDGTKEGTTEALQELISEVVGVSVDTAREWREWDELKPELIEAFALGALGGSAMRGPVEVSQAVRTIQAPANIQKALNQTAEAQLERELGEQWELTPTEEKQELVLERAKSLKENIETPDNLPPVLMAATKTIARQRLQREQGEAFNQLPPEEQSTLVQREQLEVISEIESMRSRSPVEEDSGELPTSEASDPTVEAVNTAAARNEPTITPAIDPQVASADVTPAPLTAEEASSTAQTIAAETANDAATIEPTDVEAASMDVEQTIDTRETILPADPAIDDTISEQTRSTIRGDLPVAPAEFIDFQQIPGKEPVPLFNLTQELNGRPIGSTVMGTTLTREGFALPPTETQTRKTIRSEVFDQYAQTNPQAHDMVNNVIRSARILGYEVRVKNPTTNDPDPDFRQVGGMIDFNQKVINLALSETIDEQSTIATLHEVLHALYKDSPAPIQEALVRWVEKMQDGQLRAFTDPRATDPRLQPDNPFDLPDPVFKEELLVESLALEGIDTPIAQGMIADIIRVLKDLYYRAAMSFMEAVGAPLESTAHLWANNRVQAIMAGQNPSLSLRSLVSGFKFPQDVKNRDVYDTAGVFEYRIGDGAKILPPIMADTGWEAVADLKTVTANANQRLAMGLYGTQLRGERAQQDIYNVVRYRLGELDGEYFDALAEGNEEVAAKLVAEAADLAGYNVGPVYHGGSFNQEIDPIFKVPAGPTRRNKWQLAFGVHFASSSEEANAYTKQRGKMQTAYLTGNIFDGSSSDVLNESDLSVWPEGVRKRIESFNKKWNNKETYAFQLATTLDEMPPRDASRALLEAGYSGMKYTAKANIDNKSYRPFEAYVMVDGPNQIKSADTITRDGQGNIIPLSQRFNVTEDDIRFTQRGATQNSILAEKQRTMRVHYARTKVNIAVFNEIEEMLAPLFTEYSDLSREQILRIIRRDDPQAAIQTVLAQYAKEKEEILSDFDLPDPTSDITYKDLDTVAQRSDFKDQGLAVSIKVPEKLGRLQAQMLERARKAQAKLNGRDTEGEPRVIGLQERYNNVIEKLNDAKALEKQYRMKLVEEIEQLRTDVKNNTKAATGRGEAAQLLADLIDSETVTPYPAQVEQLFRRLKITDDTPLFQINKELMTLDIDWTETSLKELYYDAIAKIKERINENPDTSLSLLLSGPRFERGDATLRDPDIVNEKLRGSALLSTMVSFVKKNQVEALALADSTVAAEEKAAKTERILNLKNALSVESLDAMRAEIKAQGKAQTQRDRLVYQLAGLEKEVRRAKRDVEKAEREHMLVAKAVGQAQKHFNRRAIEIGMGREFVLFDGADVPREIKDDMTPNDILKQTNSEPLNLKKNSQQATEKVDIALELAERGRAILRYLNSHPEYKDSDIHSLAYRRLDDMAQKLINNAISNDQTIVNMGIRNVVRSLADKAAQSATRAGGVIMKMSRVFDDIVLSGEKFTTDGAKQSDRYYDLLKKGKIKSHLTIKNLYDAALTFMDMEKVLTGDAAFDAMIESLRHNDVFREILSHEGASEALIAYVKGANENNAAAMEIRERHGLLVRDANVKDVNWATGKEVPVLRDSLNRGVNTIPRLLKSGIFSFINEFKSANPHLLDGRPRLDGKPRLWDQGDATLEEYKAFVQQSFEAAEGMIEEIVLPLLGNDRADMFPHPEIEGLKLDRVEMLSAWDEAEGNIIGTAEVLAARFGVDAKKYVPKFMGVLRTNIGKLDRLGMERYASESNGQGTRGMSKYGSEARVDDDIPSSMTAYMIYSEATNQTILKRLAAEKAFGNNLENMEKYAVQMELELKGLSGQYEAAQNAVMRENPNVPVDEKKVKKKLGKRYKKLRLAHEAVTKGYFKSSMVINGYREILGNKENSSDIGAFEEMHSFIITGMLQGWKTALKQMSQTYSTIASMRAVSQYNVFEPFYNLYGLVRSFADWPLRMFGFTALNLGPYQPRIIENGLNDVNQGVRISHAMKDTGYMGEMARDNGGRFKQAVRGISSLINRGTLGPSEGYLMPGPTPFIFRPVNQIQLILGTIRMLKYMEIIAKKLSDHQKLNPGVNLRGVTAEDLGFKNRWYWFDDAKFWDNFMGVMDRNGLPADALVEKWNARQEAGLQGLDDSSIRTAHTMVKEVYSMESMLSTRPAFSQKSTLGRMTYTLFGWSVQNSNNIIDAFVGRDISGRVQEDTTKRIQSIIAGNKAIMFHLLPSAIIFSLFFDLFDEEVQGKKSDVRPLFGSPDPKETALSVLERIHHAGPFGIIGSVANDIANIGSGKPAISFDEKVIWASTLRQFQKQISTLISTGVLTDPRNITYQQNIRPLAQSLGMGSVLSNLQIVNNLLGLENAEARAATRINTNNALRGAGRSIGLEVRTFGAGYSRAVPYTPHVTAMVLAAMSNNGDEFNKAHQNAIRAMQNYKQVSRGEAAERIAQSFQQRHPIKAVFRTVPTQKEYKAMLNAMSPALRQSVIDSIDSFNRWGETIGVKSYYGKANGKAEKSLAPQQDTPSFEEQIQASIASRYSL